MSFTDYLQTQPLLRVSVAFILGIVVGDKTFASISVWWWIAVAIAFLISFYTLHSKFPHFLSLCIYVITFCIGSSIITIADKQAEYPFHGEEPLHYEAVITNTPKVRGKILQCDLAILKAEGKTIKRPIYVKTAILRDTVSNDWQKLHIGSGIEAYSVMQPLSNYHKDGNFDYIRWLRVHGITAQTFIYYSDWRTARISLKPLSRLEIIKLKALRIRARLTSFLYSKGDNENQQSAVIAAMVLGDKHAISKETKDIYSISGGSHVLALSGLHLGIIYTILTLLFGRWRHKLLSQMLVLVAIWMYVVIVGMGSSVMRSATMLTIYSFCIVLQRDKTSVNTLSLAAICLLATNPLSLWDVGFQMSFMAVLTIVIFYKPIYNLLPLHNKLLKTVWGMTVVSITAQIGTAPLVAYYFGRFSCYFLLTNFVVIPAATIIIYGAVALFLSTPLPFISTSIAKILTFVAKLMNLALSWIANLPGSCIENIHINAIQVVLIYIIIMCISVSSVYISKIKQLDKLNAFHKRK